MLSLLKMIVGSITCDKITNGGVQRAKQQLVGSYRNVSLCPRVPDHMMEEDKGVMLKKAEVKATTQMMPAPATQYDDYDYEEEAVELQPNHRGQKR